MQMTARIVLTCVCLATTACASFGARGSAAPTIGPPISFSFDIEECKLREDGFMRKQSFHSFAGKASPFGGATLCTIQIPKAKFESLFFTCALSGYSIEPGAMPAGTPASEYEKIFTRPRMCTFRHLDQSGHYIFEGFGPGRCSFVCLPKQQA